ncbi:hypothetical protein [Brevundimonas sp.]|uniref:hypothetical protein n=1 Tax=Brevundimonas sp. TaxID=1871086 RepID=UPI0035B318A6
MTFLARLVMALLSLVVLGAATYLIVTWYRGDWLSDGDDLRRVREDWRLWTGLGLGAWSVFGRWLITPLPPQPPVRLRWCSDV